MARVVATCMSPTAGLPKYPQPEVRVGPLGIVGDWHAGPVDKHQRGGKRRPNERQVTVVAREATAAVGAERGVRIRPGDLGENFLIEGAGDLSDLAPGDRIRLGDAVLLEVTGQIRPCPQLQVRGVGVDRAFRRRRGVAAVVRQAGAVRPGDRVEIIRAGSYDPAAESGAAPARADEPRRDCNVPPGN